jgi:hypothetical protein
MSRRHEINFELGSKIMVKPDKASLCRVFSLSSIESMFLELGSMHD